MVCVYCGKATNIINSRPQKRLNQTWRRRKCASCSALFTTLEKLDFSSSIMVASGRQPSLAPLNRDKLFISIYKSLGHRPSAASDATALTDTCLGKALAMSESATIAASELKSVVQQALEHFDKAAATHYAAYHPDKV